MEEMLGARVLGTGNSFQSGLFHLNICDESCVVFPGKTASLSLRGCDFGSPLHMLMGKDKGHEASFQGTY